MASSQHNGYTNSRHTSERHDRLVVVTAKVAPSTRRAISAQAYREGLSVSALLARLIDEYMDKTASIGR